MLRLQSNLSRKSPQAASAPLVLGAVLAAGAVPAEAWPFLPAIYHLVPKLSRQATANNLCVAKPAMQSFLRMNMQQPACWLLADCPVLLVS